MVRPARPRPARLRKVEHRGRELGHLRRLVLLPDRLDLADGDDDTQLDQAGVLGYVTGQTVDLGAGSTIDGSSIVTAADYQSYLPADLADGDDDSQLDQADVLNYVTGQAVDLGTGSAVDGSAIVTASDYNSYLPADLTDGDADTLAALSCVNDGELARYDLIAEQWYCDSDQNTQLTQGEVLAYIDGQLVDLGAGASVAGAAIVTANDYSS